MERPLKKQGLLVGNLGTGLWDPNALWPFWVRLLRKPRKPRLGPPVAAVRKRPRPSWGADLSGEKRPFFSKVASEALAATENNHRTLLVGNLAAALRGPNALRHGRIAVSGSGYASHRNL